MFDLSNSLKEKMEKYSKEEGILNNIVEIDTSKIDTWEYRDRKEFELGDIGQLAKSIEINGQIQPIVVTPQSLSIKAKSNKDAQYIVIAGYRRWLACKKNGKKVRCLIENDITVEQAISSLLAENEKESISDYSKGMFYYSVLKGEKITQSKLAEKIGMTPTSLKNYLSFSRVPDEVWNEVKNMSKVSSRTSAEIASISSLGKKHVDALIAIADKIALGYGEKRIKKLVNDYLKNKKSDKTTKTIKKFKINGMECMKNSGNKILIDTSIINIDAEKLATMIESNIEDLTESRA